MRRIEFGIGIGKDVNGYTIAPHVADAMIATALDHLSVFSDGGFVARGFGYWREHEAGDIVREESITITIDTDLSDGTVRRLAHTLRALFCQTAIHVVITEIIAYEV